MESKDSICCRSRGAKIACVPSALCSSTLCNVSFPGFERRAARQACRRGVRGGFSHPCLTTLKAVIFIHHAPQLQGLSTKVRKAELRNANETMWTTLACIARDVALDPKLNGLVSPS